MPRPKKNAAGKAETSASASSAFAELQHGAQPLIQYSAQRIGIFIDVQNMYYSAKNLYGAKLNFIQAVRSAIKGRQLVRAIAYVVETPQQHEVRFFDALRLQGIELKERDLQVFSSGLKKADWDVGITVDAIAISDVLDVVILVSGDGDYLPLVEYLQNKGRKVEVMAFRNTASSKLVEMADVFVDLGDPNAHFLIYGSSTPAASLASTEHTDHIYTSESSSRRTKRTIL